MWLIHHSFHQLYYLITDLSYEVILKGPASTCNMWCENSEHVKASATHPYTQLKSNKTIANLCTEFVFIAFKKTIILSYCSYNY